jgi:hypothetical protein
MSDKKVNEEDKKVNEEDRQNSIVCGMTVEKKDIEEIYGLSSDDIERLLEWDKNEKFDEMDEFFNNNDGKLHNFWKYMEQTYPVFIWNYPSNRSN